MDDSFLLTASKEIESPRAKVWEAWNNQEKLAKWWGPAGFSSSIEELDVRDGGMLKVVMHAPNGVDYPNIYVFNKVKKPSQLIYTNEGSEEFGLAPFQSVVDLEALSDDRTKVTLKMRFTSEDEKQKHIHQFHADTGSRELLDRLAQASS